MASSSESISPPQPAVDLENIFLELAPRVYALALNLTGHREDAKDVVQDTFCVAFDRLSTFRGEAQLSTWIYTIAYRSALRARKRRRRPPTGAAVPALSATPAVHAEAVRAAFAMLGDEHRDVLSLLVIGGVEASVIGKILNIPEGTVWSRAYHARRKLRDALAALGACPHQQSVRCADEAMVTPPKP